MKVALFLLRGPRIDGLGMMCVLGTALDGRKERWNSSAQLSAAQRSSAPLAYWPGKDGTCGVHTDRHACDLPVQ